MAEKINPKLVSLSLAGVSGIFYLACVALFAIMPQAALGFFKNIFHGIDITKIAATEMSLTGTIAGFSEIIIAALIAGWLFTEVYNYIQSRI